MDDFNAREFVVEFLATCFAVAGMVMGLAAMVMIFGGGQ